MGGEGGGGVLLLLRLSAVPIPPWLWPFGITAAPHPLSTAKAVDRRRAAICCRGASAIGNGAADDPKWHCGRDGGVWGMFERVLL